MALPVFEEAAEATLMLPYTGGQPQSRHAILALNMQGGGGMEIWQYTGRTPQSPDFQVQLGDLGIYSAKIKTRDVEATFHALRKRGVSMLGSPMEDPSGCLHFYVQDPWRNVFEVVGASDWFSHKNGIHTGGIYGCTLGVADMEQSLLFYRELLGYDQIVYDTSGTFPDYQPLTGGFGGFRRILLRHSQKRQGPFSRLLGDSEIELVQTIDRQPVKIFKDRFWGDLGFIHLCFDITGMSELKRRCEAAGHPFTVDSSNSFDMGEAAGHFAYIEDPDGALIEFVETHKIPIVKKMGWYLDLRKRDKAHKPLPYWMLRAMEL
jgi:catechol 2,3-dioxygenase-like lactoylglutathione lyase family enzyme